jgi:hypothetical protein
MEAARPPSALFSWKIVAPTLTHTFALTTEISSTKRPFYSGKKARESPLVELFVDEMKEEPFEVKELVRINCERSFPEKSSGSGDSQSVRCIRETGCSYGAQQ